MSKLETNAGAFAQRYPDRRGGLRCGLPVPRPAAIAMNTHNTGDNIHRYDKRHSDFLFEIAWVMHDDAIQRGTDIMHT